jgi:hypothetical protein
VREGPLAAALSTTTTVVSSSTIPTTTVPTLKTTTFGRRPRVVAATEERLIVRAALERHHRDYRRQTRREDADEDQHPEQWESCCEDQDGTQRREDPEHSGQVLRELLARPLKTMPGPVHGHHPTPSLLAGMSRFRSNDTHEESRSASPE